MKPAALSTTTPDARLLAGRGSDGATRDDGFGAALDDLAQHEPAQATSASGRAAVGATSVGTADQGVASWLAKLAGSTTVPAATATVAKAAVTPSTSPDDAAATAGSSKADDKATDQSAATGTAPVAADPAATAMGLLAPFVAGAAVPSRADARPSSAAASVATSKTGPSPSAAVSSTTKTADDGDAEGGPNPGVALVSASSHVAPARPSMPQSALATGTAEVPSTAAAKPAAAASPEPAVTQSGPASTSTPAQDAGPTAVAAHPQPTSASLPDGTLQALAGTVSSLADEAAASGPTASAGAAEPTAAQTAPQLAPARSLTLQLTPGDLGSVTVRLHLSGDGLDVHLAVEDHKTLASIEHARDDLAAAIGDNGYRLESLVIRGADASSTSTAGSHDSTRSQGDTGTGRGSSGGSGGDASSSDRRPARDTRSSDPGSDRRSGGVFV